MAHNLDRLRQEQLAARLRRLRTLEAEAAKGAKLHKTSDRIRAALELTRAWQEAKSRGLAKADFEQAVLDGLSRAHGRRTEFRLNRYNLKRSEVLRLSETGITPQDVGLYTALSEPQKSLDAYLAGLRAAARYCEADPDEWSIDMLSKTSLWAGRPQPTAGALPRDAAPGPNGDMSAEPDIPAETLAILFDRLARYLATKNRLPDVMATILEMPCRWDMMEERIVSSPAAPMDRTFARMSPVGSTVYFEEMAPFPSVPLVRVPLISRATTLGLMPVGPVETSDLCEDDAASIFMFSSGMAHVDGNLPALGLPPDAVIERLESRVTLYREVRLAIAPVDRHGWSAVMEFRPFLCVDLLNEEGEMLRHRVRNAVDPDLAILQFYAQQEENRLVWPVIERNGEQRRVACLTIHDDTLNRMGTLQSLWAEGMLTPVYAPLGPPEPWYLGYASASATEIRHWLTPEDEMVEQPFARPWRHDEFAPKIYGADLPPQSEFYFPLGGAATDVEACLHNGLIEQALQTAIDRIVESSKVLQAELSSARETNAQRLLNRWTGKVP